MPGQRLGLVGVIVAERRVAPRERALERRGGPEHVGEGTSSRATRAGTARE
jgi:hypothetical protein